MLIKLARYRKPHQFDRRELVYRYGLGVMAVPNVHDKEDAVQHSLTVGMTMFTRTRFYF